jgi:homoserine dehydrogenase
MYKNVNLNIRIVEIELLGLTYNSELLETVEAFFKNKKKIVKVNKARNSSKEICEVNLDSAFREKIMLAG